jgi:hypothetical protein
MAADRLFSDPRKTACSEKARAKRAMGRAMQILQIGHLTHDRDPA